MQAQLILDFLNDLKVNNNRDWFQANKNQYDIAKSEVELFAAQTIELISGIDASVQSPLVKDCMFRIFRDVRFSNDKLPYKTNFGFFVARGGRKSIFPGYYFHFEPGQSMIAAGVYQPQPEMLKRIRNEVYFNSTAFSDIVEKTSFKRVFNQLDDFDKLKKAPKDFPADFPKIDLLKYRSYIVSRSITDDELLSSRFDAQAKMIIDEVQSFMAFLNHAISNE